MLAAISNGKGVAKSNLYSVYFSGPCTTIPGYGGLSNKPESLGEVGSRILFLCDEATLPGVQSNTGNMSRYLGQAPRYYPTSPIYTDIQLSFICDAQMQALKFLNDWHGLIYDSTSIGSERSTKLNYPSTYQSTMIIEKNERNDNSDIGAITAKYNIFNSWPYAIDSIPLSYGSSQLVKVTANFYYTHWELDKTISGL